MGVFAASSSGEFTRFVHRQLVLLDRESSLGNWGGFVKSPSLCPNVTVDIPRFVIVGLFVTDLYMSPCSSDYLFT